MRGKRNAPDGASVTKEEVVNEVEKKQASTRAKSYEEYLASMREEEQRSAKPLSSDLEILTNVSPEQVKKLQDEKRLYHFTPATRGALVLKEAYVAKKKEQK